MSELVYVIETVIEKRRLTIVGFVSAFCLLFLSLLAPAIQSNHTSIATRIHDSTANQAQLDVYGSPDAMTNALSQMASDVGQAGDSLEVSLLSSALSMSAKVTHVEYGIGDSARSVAILSFHGATDSATFVGHTAGASFDSAGRMIGDSALLLRGVTHMGNISSIIHPSSHTPVPVITKLEEQQASLIQSGTKGVVVASASAVNSGTGGACDDGNGNGYYPASWCNAPIDTIATIPYTSEPINRECTSYAYWYFTTIEGHTDFQAWGNAKYWASSSNYPTHSTPTVGAIAVETVGEYGHVAIVQALPGQTYAGKTVPTGYVLVSEMNYDWQGHFRYSYSPLSKFSAYIYR
jgi:surface antigen